MTKSRENLPFLRKSDVKKNIKNRFPKWETVSYCFRTFCYIYYNRLCLKNQCRLFFTIFFTCQCQLFFHFSQLFYAAKSSCVIVSPLASLRRSFWSDVISRVSFLESLILTVKVFSFALTNT